MDLTQLLTLLGIIFTPTLAGLSALFVYYNRSQEARVTEWKERAEKMEGNITTYRDSIIPVLQSTNGSLEKILDTQEVQNKLLDHAIKDQQEYNSLLTKVIAEGGHNAE